MNLEVSCSYEDSAKVVNFDADMIYARAQAVKRCICQLAFLLVWDDESWSIKSQGAG